MLSFFEKVAVELFAGNTCEQFQQIRIWLFAIIAVLVFLGIAVSHWYAKRRKIDINKYSGLADMMRQVYSFERPKFSVFSILWSCGCALVAAIYIGFSLAAMGHGCVVGPAS